LTPAEAAEALVLIADRVGRLKPLASDPEKFFVDRSELESEILEVARGLDPRASYAARPPRGRIAPGAIVAADGRRVRVETRGRTRSRSTSELQRVFSK
jgi:hypothetical protein